MCGSASGWAKMALLCLLGGVALHVAGWATLHWMTYETTGSVLEVNVGLWRQRSCNGGDCDESEVQSQYETDDFNAVRALETIVFCVVVFSAVLLAIYVLFEGARRLTVAIVLMVLCFLSGTLSLISMIVWLVTLPSPFIVSYSLGLTILAFILVFIAGTLLIPDVFEPHDYYFYKSSSSRSDLDTPTPRRNTVVTPLSFKDSGFNSRW